MENKGKVYLVGAGPGDPKLITCRGVEVISLADCVVCDKLANDELLKYARPDAEIIAVPKRIGPGSFDQQQINEIIVDRALKGKTVARLKGGDPCIFGRGGEEARLLKEQGIDFEIIPGITAALALSSHAGIMLTDRNYSSQVTFVTGTEAPDKKESNIDWTALAKFSGSIVFYMGMSNIEKICESLTASGMNPETPAAIARDISLPSQKTVTGTLSDIAEKARQQDIKAPALIIIGKAAEFDSGLNWFASKPLFGKNIVITRDRNGNSQTAEKLIAEGANPIQFDTIALKPLTGSNDFLQTIARIKSFDWVVFTSKNGVRFFFEFLDKMGADPRIFGHAKIAAIGTETAAQLREFSIKADFIPQVFTSVGLGTEIVKTFDLTNKNILLLRSELASEELEKILSSAKANLESRSVYTIEPVKQDTAELISRFENSEIDWLTFASPSAVRAFFEQVPANIVNRSSAAVAAVGPVTAGQLEKMKLKISVIAPEHTIDGLIKSIKETILK